MIFEKLFLEKSDLTRLHLYRDILSIQKPRFKVNELSEMHGASYQQTYNNLQSLMKDLQKVYELPSENFFDGNEIYRDHFTMSLTEYRNHMITNTLTFKFIDAIFNKSCRTLDEFLETNRISRSTLSRKTSDLHDYMKLFNIGISYIDLELIGDEKQIREFLFVLYYSLYLGYQWPFHHVSLAETRSLLKLINNSDFYYLYRNRVDEYQCAFRLAIAVERIKDGYPISRASRLDLIIEKNKFFNEEKVKDFEIFNLSKEYSFNELETLFFGFNHTISPFTEANVNDHNLISTFREGDSKFWQFILKYLEMLANDYSKELSTKILTDEVLLSNLIRIFYSYYVFLGSFFTISRMFGEIEHPNLTGHNSIIQLTEDFIRDNAADYEISDLIRCKHYLGEDIYQLLLPAISQIVTKDALQVKLYLEEDIVASRDLTTFLNDLRGVHVLDKEDPVELADVIISPLGHLENLPNLVIPAGTKLIFWNSESNENELYRIYREIRQIHIERKNNRAESLSGKEKEKLA
jgi:hypothetical protein